MNATDQPEYGVTMDLPGRWALIEPDLATARGTLPENAASHEAIRQCQEFLDHDEPELACDVLELYAGDNPVSRDFCWALRDAAARMQLTERAGRYGRIRRQLLRAMTQC